MTSPLTPTQFLAHCKAHKALTQTKPCKELKMPTHSPPTPADGIIATSIRHINNKFFVNITPKSKVEEYNLLRHIQHRYYF